MLRLNPGENALLRFSFVTIGGQPVTAYTPIAAELYQFRELVVRYPFGTGAFYLGPPLSLYLSEALPLKRGPLDIVLRIGRPNPNLLPNSDVQFDAVRVSVMVL